MSKKTIYLAADHAGFEHKEAVEKIIKNKFSDAFDVVDCGADSYNASDDYPDFISMATENISKDPLHSLGIIFGGSGQGEAMVANRYPHVRATTYYGGEPEILTLSKEHNNANVLSIGARFVKKYDLEEVVKTWLDAKFLGEERHNRRVEKLESLKIPLKNHSLTDKLKTCKQFLGMK